MSTIGTKKGESLAVASVTQDGAGLREQLRAMIGAGQQDQGNLLAEKDQEITKLRQQLEELQSR